MHNKIFQVSDEPIFETSGDYDIPDWFVGEIADYADKFRNKDKILELQWDFLKYLNEEFGFKVDDNLISFTTDKAAINKYFESKYSEFKNIISNINSDVDLSVFTGECEASLGGKPYGNIEEIMYRLNSWYNHKFSIYVLQHKYNCLITLYQYMRDLMHELNSKDSTTIYLGSVYDYHY